MVEVDPTGKPWRHQRREDGTHYIYEEPRNPAVALQVRGVGRIADEPRAVMVMLNERPTNGEIRAFHDLIRDWRSSGLALKYRLEDTP